MLLRRFVTCMSIASLAGCSSPEPEINTVCQRDAIGNYIIKWETTPQIEGQLHLFVSDYPDMRTYTSARYADIRDGVVTYVTNDNISRKYFRLLFNDKYEVISSSRLVTMDSISNFRDLGGYPAADNKTTRWGKVFRSGDISRMTEWDEQRLDKLKIKTIIDLRSESEALASPITYTKARIVSIPVDSDIDQITERIVKGRVLKGDVSLFLQDAYIQFTENTEPFAEALSVFTDELNYPILFLSTRGKDRTGFLSAMLLSALNVSEKAVFYDYTEVNDYIDLSPYRNMARQMDINAQEAMTVALSANDAFLDLAFRKIKKEKGSVGRFIREDLQLTEKQRETLKELLLF